MKSDQQFCFKHRSGEDIYLFALHNSNGTQVMISNYGAIITSFKIKQPDGTDNDIVLGFDKMEDYLGKDYLQHYPWFGAAIGRYGNRIKNAMFHLDEKTYLLSKNNSNDQLHGGHEGFDKKVWALVSCEPLSVELSYTSAAGEEGYPGNLRVNVRFELSEQDELTYTFTANTDQPTIVNLTHHGYFNLDNGKGTIGDHEVKIYASSILEQDGNFVATGNYIPVKDSLYDFTRWKKISKHWKPEDGYDQSYVADKTGRELSLLAEARSKKSKLALQVWSTEPVVHFYTGKWIPNVKGKDGQSYGPYSAFCLETQVHPNAINIPHFPNTILRPGEQYYQKTIYKIIRG
jgi:aldose 1-epimerase